LQLLHISASCFVHAAPLLGVPPVQVHMFAVHVILPPWYDAVVELPSAKHLNGVLDALE
jgi:hypothetical protein